MTVGRTVPADRALKAEGDVEVANTSHPLGDTVPWWCTQQGPFEITINDIGAIS
jgi:hypothetical protein